MPQGAVSNGKHIDAFIPPHLRDMFYRHPTRPYAWNNGLDPYGFTTNGLALYLPLWALKDSAFKSIDPYEHICTVTGATQVVDGWAFDGTDDKITVADHDVLDLTTIGTLGIWAKITNFDILRMLFHKGVNHYSMYAYTTTGIVGFGKSGVDDVQSAAGISANTWHHLVGVRTGGSNYLFIDGVADNSGVTANFEANATDLHLGEQSGGANDLLGVIGEVWIYNRALSAGEISRIYNSTAWRYQ